MLKNNIPYFDLSRQNALLKQDMLTAVERVIDNNTYILGPEVESFEERFSKYLGSQYVIGVNSGTSALHLATKLLNINPGDEIITTPFTFAATAWAISYVGAKPVFVDIEDTYFNMNPDNIEAAITDKTKAIIAVHLYGHPCEMDPIMDICEKYGLYLIEDASQAHGARYKGQSVGTLGNIGTFSFYPPKNLGACGEAGALVTDEEAIAYRARNLRNHGSSQRYIYDEVGHNYRMDGIQAALLNVKLAELEEWNDQRKHAVCLYNHHLSSCEYIHTPEEAPWAESAYHLYTIATSYRNELNEFLAKEGIGTAIHYPLPLHLQPCYDFLGYENEDFPVAEKMSDEVLSLPLFPGITEDEIEHVSNTVIEFFKK